MNNLDVLAAVEETQDDFHTNGVEVVITKTIYKDGDPYVYYCSHVGDNFQVTIEVENPGVAPIYNISITSPEANITGKFPQ